MIKTVEAPDSGYRFMPGVSQYSCGVAALPGFALERVRFAEVVPLARGFEKIAEIIKAAGRPLTAFAACELRSPAPFTEAGFQGLQRHLYQDAGRMGHHERWRQPDCPQQCLPED